MNTPYPLMYRLGFKPWDNGKIPQPLRALVEGPDALPPGKALDLGCGTGTHSVYLAQHGWTVTGVDLVPRALRQAERKAAAAGVRPTFVAGSIARLTDLIPDRDYSLLLDVACFHGLPAELQRLTANQITQVAQDGALFLLFGYTPGNHGPLPRGIAREEVEALFGGEWDLLWERRISEAPRLRGPLRNAVPTGFCLRKHG